MTFLMKSMRMHRFLSFFMLLLLLFSGDVRADERESLSFLRHVAVNSKKLLAVSVFGMPSARTMGDMNGFAAGAAATEPRRFSGDDFKLDASAALGLGLGNAYKAVGFDSYLGIVSVNPEGKDGGFGVGEDGNLGFKLGKSFLTDRFDSISLAVGVNNFVSWGDADLIEENVYSVMTFGSAVVVDETALPVTVSVGVGSKQKDNDSFGMFAGVGVGIANNVDVSLGYNASRWMAGFGIDVPGVPLVRRLFIQLGVDDLFNENDNRRGVLIVAVPFSL